MAKRGSWRLPRKCSSIFLTKMAKGESSGSMLRREHKTGVLPRRGEGGKGGRRGEEGGREEGRKGGAESSDGVVVA